MDEREVEEVGDTRTEGAERRDRSQWLPAGNTVRKLGESERGDQDGSRAELTDRELERRDVPGDSPSEEDGEGVAEGGSHDCERAHEPAATLHADEERDADEAHSNAYELRAADALSCVDPAGEQDGEDRRRSLDDRGQTGVDSLLREAEQPERKGVVEKAEERDCAQPATQGREPASESGERQEDGRTYNEPSEHDGGRRELADADLDEEERRSPDRGEGGEQDQVAAAHAALTVTVSSRSA